MPLEITGTEVELQPLALEKVRPLFARTVQVIAGSNRPVAFTWNGQPAVLKFSAVKSLSPAARVARVIVDGHEFQVQLERLPDVSALSAALAGLDLEVLPAELACGVIAAALETGLNQLKGKGVDVVLAELLPAGSPVKAEAESLAFVVEKDGDPGWIRGTLKGDDAGLEHLAQLMARVPAQAVRSLNTLPLLLSFIAGRVTLSQQEFRDAVLADLQGWRIQGTCEVLIAGRRHAAATWRDKTLTIQQFIMSEPAPTPAATEPLALVDQLEVELTFLVGTHAATLEQLRSLAPGACIELPTPANQAVTICANGRAIGKGELLDIGNRIGVRITELAKA
jgi:type III secretion system YscQ/HrcQ family protein